MYGTSFPVGPEFDSGDFLIPIGKAKILREGTDVTIVSYSKGLQTAMRASEELAAEGISCEVINLRSIRPIDYETIFASVKKTGRLLTVEEAWPQHGVGSEIIASCMESSVFDYMDAPPQRIATADVPNPYAFNLEEAWYPQPSNVINVVREMVSRPYKK